MVTLKCNLTAIIVSLTSLRSCLRKVEGDEQHKQREDQNKDQKAQFLCHLCEYFKTLISLSTMMSVKLADLVRNKLPVNSKRYRQDLCVDKKEMPKWDNSDMSDKTGCSKKEQIIMFTREQVNPLMTEEENMQFLLDKWLDLAEEIKQFSAKRGWLASYDELSLPLSLAAELGELAASVQWNNDENKTIEELSDKTKHNICEEIADLAIYGFHCHRTIYGGSVDADATFLRV